MNARIKASRVRDMTARNGIGVSAATSPGSTHRLSSDATAM